MLEMLHDFKGLGLAAFGMSERDNGSMKKLLTLLTGMLLTFLPTQTQFL
jgi:hypothetical protein